MVGTAAEALGEIYPGCAIFGITKGQFSLIDYLDKRMKVNEQKEESDNEEDLEKSENLYKLKSSAFRNLGKQSKSAAGKGKGRSAFKRIR